MVPSVCFDKCIMSRISHCSIIQNCSLALKTPRAPPSLFFKVTVPEDTPASDHGSGWHAVRGIVRIYNLCLFGGLGERDLVIVVLLCVSLTSNEIRHLFICFFAGQLFPSVEQLMESSERFQTFECLAFPCGCSSCVLDARPLRGAPAPVTRRCFHSHYREFPGKKFLK